jgi:endonuclease YncB( thermonuclease family)
MILVILVSFLIGFWPIAVHADEISGFARVIDGDTIVIKGQRIRLHGIDAPERNQKCERAGQLYRCGQFATLALANKTKERSVKCEQRAVDRYNRIVAVCTSDNEDLNAWMVIHGHAVAYRRYSLDYVAAEEISRSRKHGIWAGRFIFPWLWRRGKRLQK